jgi:hypothetical protein
MFVERHASAHDRGVLRVLVDRDWPNRWAWSNPHSKAGANSSYARVMRPPITMASAPKARIQGAMIDARFVP